MGLPGDTPHLLVTADTDRVEAAKSQFLALLGHELRTPVTTVVATVDLLRAQHLSPEAREIADQTFRATQSLKTLADDLLDLARLETGRLTVKEEPVQLRRILEGVVEPLQQEARSNALLLLAAPAPDLPATVFGDGDRLHQVLAAVVGNAVKFTSAGEVVVTAARDGDDAYVLTVSDTGPGIPEEHQAQLFAPFVQVDSSTSRSHEGAGLGLALAARLVERMGGAIAVRSAPGEGTSFVIRLPLAPAPDEFGSGVPQTLAGRRIGVAAPTSRSTLALGWLLAGAGARPVPLCLADVPDRAADVDTVVWCDDSHDPEAVGRADAVVEALTPAHRALMISTTDPRVGVVRRPGVLTSPLVLTRVTAALNQTRTGIRGAPVRVPELGAGRVLLAEDNEVNRTVFRRMIELLGLTCDAVPDGEEAVDALTHGPPYDVVLMDVQMPRTDGLEATRRIRAAGIGSPILALTATALHGDRERCLAAGMDDYLSKPITLPELRAALEPYVPTGPRRKAKQ